jgi:HSP20 family protein
MVSARARVKHFARRSSNPSSSELSDMNITRWEPFREVEDMFRQYSPFFSRAMRRAEREEEAWRPVADISETDKEYLIKAELPEVPKEDVKVTFEQGMLTISGERRQEKKQEERNEIHIESFYGSFSRSFALPDNVDPKSIRAESKDGVLKIRIPKTKPSKPEQPIAIEVK